MRGFSHAREYQFEHDYRFDSSKLERAFGLTATTYREGIAAAFTQRTKFYKGRSSCARTSSTASAAARPATTLTTGWLRSGRSSPSVRLPSTLEPLQRLRHRPKNIATKLRATGRPA